MTIKGRVGAAGGAEPQGDESVSVRPGRSLGGALSSAGGTGADRVATTIKGLAASLPMDNVDTDQIIPARYLTTVSKDGLAEGLFADLDVSLPRAPILAACRNFGTGSSREHAVWALAAAGFRCVLAESFADIFYNNALKNGLLPVVLGSDALERCRGQEVTVCLETQQVSLNDGSSWTFPIDPFRKRCLLSGLDDLGYLLSHAEAIAKFEERRLSRC